MNQLPLLEQPKRLTREQFRCACGHVVTRNAWSLARAQFRQIYQCPGCGKRVEIPAEER